jgi:REP element-mobilizing transposase RayT
VTDGFAITHVTARGNARASIFRDETDCLTFLRMVARPAPEELWRCHAYCLMPNHYHLLLEAPVASLGKAMHRLNGAYARRFNVRHGRVGHVFGGRYHGELVARDEHLLEAVRYVVLNPVRARLCEEPGEWPWSSYCATAGLDASASWVEVSTIREMAGGADGFRRFVAEGDTNQRLQPA